MLVITGLGNIGENYNNTRHNIGFIAIDKIAEKYNFPEWKQKDKYIYSKQKIENIEILLVKPTTFMNLSGEAILNISTVYKIKPDDIIVIHDDLDLELGKIKIKTGGGNAGHNGLKNIDEKIGKNYHRIRIGISKPTNPYIDTINYVIGKFSKQELEIIDRQINILLETFNEIIAKNFNKALNFINNNRIEDKNMIKYP